MKKKILSKGQIILYVIYGIFISIISLISTIFIIIILLVAAIFFEIAYPDYYSDEELLYTSGIDAQIYEYSNKVQLHITHDFEDELILRNDEDDFYNENNNDDKSFFGCGETVLSGNFDKYAWNDYMLFILMDEVYYVFDIESYPNTPYDEEGYFNYELKEYTEEEFLDLYPEQENFEWINNDSKRSVFAEKIGFWLPDSAKFIEHGGTLDISQDAGYLSATIQLQDDEETEKFIKKIKKYWIVPPLESSDCFTDVEEIAFKDGFVPYSDSYYYYYYNPYTAEEEPIRYVYSITVAALDEENKTIYFYTIEE